MTNHIPPLQPLPEEKSTRVRQSYAQSRLWFLHQMEPTKGQHNILVRMSLSGPAADAARVAAAFTGIYRRHSALRACYLTTSEGQFQCLSKTPYVELRVIDLIHLTPEEKQREFDLWMQKEQATPFDLETGPMIRPFLIELAEDKQELVFCIHHIAFDGCSGEILLRDLARFYATGESGKPEPGMIQYVDFAAWEPNYITPELIESEVAFWRDHLADFPVQLEFAGRSRKQGPAVAGRHHFVIEPALIEGVKTAAKAYRQPLFTTLLTLFNLWVYHLSGQSRFLVGTDVHGRDLPELADIVGFFVNQLTLKSEISEHLTLSELLAHTRASTKTALVHKQLPFDILVSSLTPQRQANRGPFFQVKFNYQRNRFSIDGLGDAKITHTQVIQDLAGFDLVLDLMHGRDGVEANLEYNRQLFSAQEIERFTSLWLALLTHFESLLELSVRELRQRLQQWESTRLLNEQQTHIHQSRARLLKTARRPVRAS